MAQPDDLRRFIEELLQRPGTSLTLDEVAEVIGTAQITTEEIGQILDALEAHGRTIGVSEMPSAPEALSTVLATARVLSTEFGRKPTPKEIASRSGLSEQAVHMALMYAQVLQR